MSAGPATRSVAYRAARGTAHGLAAGYLRVVTGGVRNDRGRLLHLDWRDARARQLLMRRGVQDRPAVTLWRRAVAAVDPTVVLDVGCNYGEVVLSADYAAGCRVHCVEANPHVAALLRRSLAAALPAAVLTVAAADRAAGSAYFVADARSSGLGRTTDDARGATAELPAVTCDGLVAARPDDRLVFKVDVEGNEIRVLDGLAGTLDEVAVAVGVVEFHHLHRAEQEELVRRRTTYAVRTAGHTFVRLDAAALTEVFPVRGVVRPGFLKDVVVTAGRDEHRLAGPLGLPAAG